MTKRVLDVGNCDPDHAAISAFFSSNFDVQMGRAKLPADGTDFDEAFL